MVTTLLSPLGEAAPAVWLALARAGTLITVALAAVAAAGLVGGRARFTAAAAAGLAVLALEGFAGNGALGNSEGLLAALALGALLCDRRDHRGVAFGLGLAAGLIRPEVWQLLAVYALVLWRSGHRRPLAGLALLPLLWLGPELWGSGELGRSAQRARVPNPGAPALAEVPALEVLDRFVEGLPLAAVVGGVGALVVALVRRDRQLAVLAAAIAAWVGMVAAMSHAGYSGEERYLLVAGVGVAVLAGVGAGEAHRWAAERLPARIASLAAAAGLAAIALTALPAAAADLGLRVAHDAALRRDLRAAVLRAGGPARLRRCGPAFAGRYRFPLVAWRLRVPISALSLVPRRRGVLLRSRLTPRARPEPQVPSGWRRDGAAGTWEVWTAC